MHERDLRSRWKIMSSNFPRPPAEAVFGSEVFSRFSSVTGGPNPLKILSSDALVLSERARPP